MMNLCSILTYAPNHDIENGVFKIRAKSNQGNLGHTIILSLKICSIFSIIQMYCYKKYV